MVDGEVARLRQYLSDRAQVGSSRDLQEILSVRGTLESLSTTHKKDKIELRELKIQMAYQKDIMKDAEAKSIVLRKRLRELEESHKWERMLRERLAAW